MGTVRREDWQEERKLGGLLNLIQEGVDTVGGEVAGACGGRDPSTGFQVTASHQRRFTAIFSLRQAQAERTLLLPALPLLTRRYSPVAGRNDAQGER